MDSRLAEGKDTSAQREGAEISAQQQRRAFEIALSHTPDFTYIFDLEGRFSYVNRALLELWQKPLEAAVGRNFFDLGYPPELAERLQRQIQQVIESKKPLRDQTAFTGPTGASGLYEYIFVPVLGADGRTEAVVGSTRDVTEQKQAEEARFKSEERLNFALQAGGGVGVWDWDVPRDQVYANARFAELFSVSPERAAAGAPIADFIDAIHPDDRARVAGLIERARDDAGEYHAEYRIARKDGSIRWVDARGRCHSDESGQAARFPGVVFDITERKDAEAVLAGKTRLASLGAEVGAAITQLADLPEALHRCAQAVVDHLDASFARIWTLASGEKELVLQASAGLYTHLDGVHGRIPVGSFKIGLIAQERQPHLTNDVAHDARVSDLEWAQREGMVAFAGYPLLVQDRLVGVLGLFARHSLGQDALSALESVATSIAILIERKWAEALLQESERQFRTLAETIPHLAWMADETGHIFWYNRRWYEYTGTNFDEMQGWGWQRLHDPAVLPAVLARWAEAIATGDPFEMTFPLKSAHGEFRSFLTRVEPVKDSQGRVTRWFGTNTDITDQRNREEELSRMNRELEEFAYVASHDLQEPLRMVNIYTQLIIRQCDAQDPKLAQYAGFVHRGVLRMETLLRDLLTFSRSVHAEQLPVGTANLSEALKEALSVLNTQIEEVGAVVTVAPLPVVRGDTNQLGHVFQNVLSNALKYRRQDVPTAIDISAKLDDDHWIISVKDNGIGFEPQYAERIFGLFKRLHKDEYEGTGLGLAICQRIVERYGGRIWAESTPGEGSVFHFSLPWVEA